MPNKNHPLISVVIPAHNEEKYIGAAVKSAFNQNFDKSLYEVVVVDNVSTDQTAKIAKDAGAIVVYEPKKGNTVARIKGINSSRGQIIAFTDADCIVPDYWLSKLYSRFEVDPKLDAIGGVFNFWDGNYFLKFLAKISQRATYHISGGNMSFRKNSYIRVGGFDPKVTLGEDLYLHLKFKKHGKVIIDYSNIVEMSSRRFSDHFLKTIFMYFSNDLALIIFKKPLFSTFKDIR